MSSFPSFPSFRRPEVVLVAIVAVALVAMVAVAITGGDHFDRPAAVERVVADSNGRLTVDQARCYVDRVHTEVGGSSLSPGAHPTDAELSRMTAIRVDCVGVANLGVVPPDDTASAGTGVPSTESGNLPRRPGDDGALDALYQQCQAGYGAACDDLFTQAPVGSVYESFAVTCGNRTRELSCAAVYVSPGITNPPTTPSTTAPTPPG